MSVKNIGRPRGVEFSELKSIRLTPKQASNWNPDKIRDFLNNGKLRTNRDLNKEGLKGSISSLLEVYESDIPIEVMRALELFLRKIKKRD